MRCLPYESRINKHSDGKYHWFNKYNCVCSFNDQPSSVSFGKTLSWRDKHGQRHRGNNKPAYVNLLTGREMWYSKGELIKEEII